MNPEAGSAFSFEWKDSAAPATAQGEILELVPDTRLVLSWFMEADGVTSTASFDLADAEEGGTLLRFRHGGFPQDSDWEPRFPPGRPRVGQGPAQSSLSSGGAR